MEKILKGNGIIIISLIAIFILALFLRAVKLSEYPVGFQTDEAILGYTGYSIIHTLKDTNGVFLPMYTEVFGDYIPTGYHYLTIPPILLFGLSEFSTRLPGALIGALMVFPIFFLTFSLFRNKTVSIMSSLFISISPWNTILSRGSSEALVSIFFVIFGFSFVLQSIRNKKTSYILYGMTFLIISFFFYHTPRLFVPIMFISTAVFILGRKNKFDSRYIKYFISSCVVTLLAVAVLTLSFKGSTARFDQISIFSFPETRLVMEEQIREDGAQNPLITRVFHNKVINFSLTFAQNYFEYLSFNNLFLKPGLPKMFAIPNTGLIYAVFIPFFLYGIVKILADKDKPVKLAIVWILVAPITAALTVDDSPNMRRAAIVYPIIEIISVFGLVSFFTVIRRVNRYLRNFVTITIVIAFGWSLLYFLHQYYIHGEKHQPWYRNNGFREMMKVVNENYNEYDKVVITKTGGGYPLVLFYSKFSPAEYQSLGSPKDRDYGGFGEFIFVPNECPSKDQIPHLKNYKKILFVDHGICKPPSPDSKMKFTEILREDGSLGFRIIY